MLHYVYKPLQYNDFNLACTNVEEELLQSRRRWLWCCPKFLVKSFYKSISLKPVDESDRYFSCW